MKSLLKQFRTELSQSVLNFLWATWSQVGVMGGATPSQSRIVDPEPLLLLTWQCGRQDPRMFDEVLDWLVQNGRWVNVVRLTTLLADDQICPAALTGAVAAFMAERDKTPKWRNLARRTKPESDAMPEPLFQREGKPLVPVGEDRDTTFLEYGWLRSSIQLRGQAQGVPAWTPVSLILKCRALFGVNIRADVFACLVARGPATASALARDLGYSQRRVHETLVEMQLGGQFQTRFDGNRKEFSIESSKGWQLLFESTPQRAVWFDWRAFGRGISTVWNKAFTMKEEGLTTYIFESETAKTINAAQSDFAAAGIMLPDRATPIELLEKLKRL